MPHRKNIELRTKFFTEFDCIVNCVELNQSTAYPWSSFSSSLYGQTAGNWFDISCNRKSPVHFYHFVGRVEEREDGVYMVGTISMKKYYIYYLIGMDVLLLLMVSTFQPYRANWQTILLFLGFILVTDLYVLLHDGLYRIIKRKLCTRWSDRVG